jgi:hypothetical protein
MKRKEMKKEKVNEAVNNIRQSTPYRICIFLHHNVQQQPLLYQDQFQPPQEVQVLSLGHPQVMLFTTRPRRPLICFY